MKSLLIKSLVALTLVSSVSAFAGDDIVLFCNTKASARLLQTSINCLADGSDCLFISRRQGERRMENLSLSILSAGHGQVILGSATGLKIEMSSEAPRTATVFDAQGVLAECAEQ